MNATKVGILSHFFKKYVYENNFIFISILFMLSLFVFWKILSFDFFQDDWIFLWNAVYQPFSHIITFRHPATPLEAAVFFPILGLHPLFWEFLGIVIKVYTAYLVGNFIFIITKSHRARFLFVIFFSTAYAGMYSVNAFNFHVVEFVGICILLSLTSLGNVFQGNEKSLWKFLFFATLGIFLDPGRGLAIFFILPLFPFLFSKNKQRITTIRFLIKPLIIFCLALLALLALWYVIFPIGDTQLGIFLRGMHTNPTYMVTKTKDIGNYFATIANLFTYPIFSMHATPPVYETADYQRFFGISGFILFIGACATFFYGLKKKSKPFLTASFFVLWTFLLYIPNFLAEPRRPMDPQHHYLFISAVGYICFIAYVFTFIKNKWLLIVVSVLFITLNIYKINTVLSLESPYRSAKLIESAMQKIAADVPQDKPNQIFFFRGDYDWLGNSITFFGGSHYLLLKHDANGMHLPQLTFDGNLVFTRLCFPQPTYEEQQYQQVSLSDIFAWNAIKPGVLIDTTQQERQTLLHEALQKHCALLK